MQHALGKNEVLWVAHVLPWGYEKEIQYGLACNATGLTSSQGILLQWLCFILRCLVCLLMWSIITVSSSGFDLLYKDPMTHWLLPIQLCEASFKIIRCVPVGWLAENQRKHLLNLLNFFLFLKKAPLKEIAQIYKSKEKRVSFPFCLHSLFISPYITALKINKHLYFFH